MTGRMCAGQGGAPWPRPLFQARRIGKPNDRLTSAIQQVLMLLGLNILPIFEPPPETPAPPARLTAPLLGHSGDPGATVVHKWLLLLSRPADSQDSSDI